MTKPTRPAPVRCLDERGRSIVKVPVDRGGRRFAILDAADFDALPAELSMAWTCNPNRVGGPAYVKAPEGAASGNLINIGRIVLGAGPKRRVTYMTDNRLDLRRRNLRLSKGGAAKRDDRGLCQRDEAA